MLETKIKNCVKIDMNKNKDILFFSKFCNHCNKFNERLEKSSNLKENTLFFCIDNNREKHNKLEIYKICLKYNFQRKNVSSIL